MRGFIFASIKVCLVILIASKSYFAVAQVDLSSLSEQELKREIAKMFVVGIETDYANSSSSSRLRELVVDIGVGGIMLNSYNFPQTELSRDENRENAFHSAKSLFLPIQRHAQLTNYAPLVFVDFESIRYSSVEYPLFSPPPALTIGSTGDTEYAYYVGKAAAYQLSRLGVDVILGPVLDSDNASRQEDLNTTITTRSFSDSLDVITLFSRRYIEGLNSIGIGVIGKHFPSYSSVSENPHGSVIRFSGSLQQIERNMQPFKDNIDILDGVMTSHLIIDELGSKPFTFNENAMSKILLSSFDSIDDRGDSVFITDDLSDMEATLEYMRSVNIGYDDVALEAFKAGHDFLLFSHIGNREDYNFHYDDLVSAIDSIYDYVIGSRDGLEKLGRSLRKIEAFREKMEESRSKVYDSRILDYSSSQIFPKGTFNNLESFLASLYDASTIGLKGVEFPSLANHPTSSKFTIIASQASFDIFSTEFESNPQVDVIEFSSQVPSERIDEVQEVLDASDIVYVVVESVDDANTIHWFAYAGTRYLNRVVFLIHENPKILKSQVLARSDYIFGNFSRAPEAYMADVRLIRGDLIPRSVSQLPIELNDGQLHSLEDFEIPFDSTAESGELEIFNTNRERELSIQVEQLEKERLELMEKISVLEEKIESMEGSYGFEPSSDRRLSRVLSNRIELGYTVPSLMILFSIVFGVYCLMVGKYISSLKNESGGFRSNLYNVSRVLIWSHQYSKVLFWSFCLSLVLLLFFIFPKFLGLQYLIDGFSENKFFGFVFTVVEDMYPGDLYLSEMYDASSN